MKDTKDLPETAALQPVRKGHIGLIVAGSVITGLIVAAGLAVVVFGGAAEPVITGVVLLAFGLGWAMLALLSSRRTSQPQRWALVPAVLMGALGLAYLAFRPGTGTLEAFGWVWPIALLALVIWMIIQSRRSLRSWSRPVILYPSSRSWPSPRRAGDTRRSVTPKTGPLTPCPASSSMWGGKPLIVVTAAKNAQTGWLSPQDERAALSANSVHRVMQNATHTSLTEDKTDSRISSQAILDVVHAVRSGTPLAN